jgi:hypothetical protein
MSRAYKIPELKFEGQYLTLFAGLVILQQLVLALELKNRLWRCFPNSGDTLLISWLRDVVD